MSRTLNFQVIVLTGGSSSGKSSIARALQELLPGIWLTYGVDTIIDALPGGGTGLSALTKGGAHLILDEVLLSGSAGQERMRSIFSDAGLIWVGVHCEPDVAATRERQRLDRVEGMARQQALRVHAGVVYDVEVDTTHCSAAECALDLANRFSLDTPCA